MNENINRHEAELNEQELASVSGGDVGYTPEEQGKAISYCNWCDIWGRCGHHSGDLARYIHQNGDINYSSEHSAHNRCPFHKAATGG